MTRPRPDYTAFRHRLGSGDHLLGTFIKTPTSHATEMLGQLGFDFVVFDQEHAPIGIQALDVMVLAARASNVAGIVRVAEPTEGAILSVLDCGAAGILVPHVASVETAARVAAACRYRGGTRGFANTTRAGGFGAASFADHKRQQDDTVTCIAMIEDVEALPRIDAILAVDGIDGIFIGRGDLTAAIDAPSMTSAETHALVEPVLQAARGAGKPVIMLCPDRADAARMAGYGVTAFMVSSDHGFLRSAAQAALAEFAAPITG